MGPALGPKSGPAGLLIGLNASCRAHSEQPNATGCTAGKRIDRSNMNAGLDAGSVQLGAVPAGGLFRLFNLGKYGDTQFVCYKNVQIFPR